MGQADGRHGNSLIRTTTPSGGVDPDRLALRPAIRVIEQRQRLSTLFFGALQRIGVTVERVTGGGEQGQTIEHGGNLVVALARVFVPALEITTVLRLPVLVQVQQNVETAVKEELGI